MTLTPHEIAALQAAIPNFHEIVSLLRVVAFYDHRPVSAEVIKAFAMAAHLAEWTFPEAEQAVHRHYAFSPDYLKPGHITQILQAEREAAKRGSAPAYEPLPPANRSTEEGRRRARLEFRPVLDRIPQARHFGQLPWSLRTGRPRTSEEDARRREAARLELERLRRDPGFRGEAS